MAYVTAKEVIDRWEMLGDIGEAVINSSYIPLAEAEINGLLAPYYTVPFSSNNLVAKDLTLKRVYIEAGTFSTEKYDHRSAAYSHWLKRIKRLQTGEEVMTTIDGTVVAPALAIMSTTTGYEGTFSLLDAEQQTIDPDLLQNIADDMA